MNRLICLLLLCVASACASTDPSAVEADVEGVHTSTWTNVNSNSDGSLQFVRQTWLANAGSALRCLVMRENANGFYDCNHYGSTALNEGWFCKARSGQGWNLYTNPNPSQTQIVSAYYTHATTVSGVGTGDVMIGNMSWQTGQFHINYAYVANSHGDCDVLNPNRLPNNTTMVDTYP